MSKAGIGIHRNEELTEEAVEYMKRSGVNIYDGIVRPWMENDPEGYLSDLTFEHKTYEMKIEKGVKESKTFDWRFTASPVQEGGSFLTNAHLEVRLIDVNGEPDLKTLFRNWQYDVLEDAKIHINNFPIVNGISGRGLKHIEGLDKEDYIYKNINNSDNIYVAENTTELAKPLVGKVALPFACSQENQHTTYISGRDVLTFKFKFRDINHATVDRKIGGAILGGNYKFRVVLKMEFLNSNIYLTKYPKLLAKFMYQSQYMYTQINSVASDKFTESKLELTDIPDGLFMQSIVDTNIAPPGQYQVYNTRNGINSVKTAKFFMKNKNIAQEGGDSQYEFLVRRINNSPIIVGQINFRGKANDYDITKFDRSRTFVKDSRPFMVSVRPNDAKMTGATDQFSYEVTTAVKVYSQITNDLNMIKYNLNE